MLLLAELSEELAPVEPPEPLDAPAVPEPDPEPVAFPPPCCVLPPVVVLELDPPMFILL